MAFSRGKVTKKLTKGKGSYEDGHPDPVLAGPEIFTEGVEFRAKVLADRLQELAFLNKGVEISSSMSATRGRRRSSRPRGGLVDFVKYLAEGASPLHRVVYYRGEEGDGTAEVEIALQWNNSYAESFHSFANTINTHEGGMHEEGLKKALTNVLNRYARAKGLLKEKEDNLIGEDVREGLIAIIVREAPRSAVRGPDEDASSATPSCARSSRPPSTRKLADMARGAPGDGKRIVTKALRGRKARLAAKQARDLTRRKSFLESGSLPGKLADCQLNDPAACELYIVEGTRPAARPSRPRDPATQAILPIRGKILNVEKARLHKILENIEIQALITAIGTGIGDEFDIDEGAVPPHRADGRRRRRRRAHPHAAADLLLPLHARS